MIGFPQDKIKDSILDGSIEKLWSEWIKIYKPTEKQKIEAKNIVINIYNEVVPKPQVVREVVKEVPVEVEVPYFIEVEKGSSFGGNLIAGTIGFLLGRM